MSTTGQFIGNDVRLYWRGNPTWLTEDYRTATGAITADTLRPDVLVSLLAPDSIRAGDTVRFDAQVIDEDTVLDAWTNVWDGLSRFDSIPLANIGNDHYRGAYVVPFEGLFHYKAQAEDRWENVGSSPDTGWATFETFGWSKTDPRFIVHPSSFSVQIFPNPSNGWPFVQLSPEWFAQGAVTVSVYNLLGQKVVETNVRSDGPMSAKRDLADGGQSAPTASGVFVLRVSNRQRSALQKFVILK